MEVNSKSTAICEADFVQSEVSVRDENPNSSPHNQSSEENMANLNVTTSDTVSSDKKVGKIHVEDCVDSESDMSGNNQDMLSNENSTVKVDYVSPCQTGQFSYVPADLPNIPMT